MSRDDINIDEMYEDIIKTSQVGGSHYKDKSVQPWDAMQSWMSSDQFEGYLRGNVIKYLCRYDKKGGVEDLYKARHYLEKLIINKEG